MFRTTSRRVGGIIERGIWVLQALGDILFWVWPEARLRKVPGERVIRHYKRSKVASRRDAIMYSLAIRCLSF